MNNEKINFKIEKEKKEIYGKSLHELKDSHMFLLQLFDLGLSAGFLTLLDGS